MEVYWDFRSTACNTDNAPALTYLPRSTGSDLLAGGKTLDAVLIRLDAVPVGSHGRAYLGWDTRDPVIDENVIAIHYPTATPMRIAYGRIETINQTISAEDVNGATHAYEHETRVGWDHGITEPGSSGACLLLADGTYRVAGALTGGPDHRCGGGPDINFDYFSSFRDFYTEISPAYLTGDNSDPGYAPPEENKSPACFGGRLGARASENAGDLFVLALVIAIAIGWSRIPGSATARVNRLSRLGR
jgi:hypothetical protein